MTADEFLSWFSPEMASPEREAAVLMDLDELGIRFARSYCPGCQSEPRDGILVRAWCERHEEQAWEESA